MPLPKVALLSVLLFLTTNAMAGVGDPQARTDHPWYPGELACSTFERLAATQAEVYQRVTGIRPETDEQKALAAWLWRNTHYAHGEEGAEDLWGGGFTDGLDMRTREYWTGLFAHGFGLCGTTHSQWTAEIDALLGHARGRGVGVDGHNAFEVFLKGGLYKDGKWVLLDHDLSTVIYDEAGKSLLSIPEIGANLNRLTDRKYKPDRQHGWLVSGLDPGDAKAYRSFEVAESLSGYAAAPPTVHLRRGESLRRYHRPGLDDGKTFVFWGRNYNTGGIPGPSRSETWVNQPDAMHGSRDGSGHKPGQARFANAVYRYQPDFSTDDYREGVVEEDDRHVVFEFSTPYIIAATPRDPSPWGIYESGCRNGLVLSGHAACPVAISVDDGRTWQPCGDFKDGMDLTDRVKGHRHYLIRFGTSAKTLMGSGLTMTTVCQANAAILPRLKDGGSRVTFAASGRAVRSAGPNIDHAETHLIDGHFATPRLTLELATPRREPILAIHASAHVNSSNPPDSSIRYQIDTSTDAGRSWKPLVKDWTIPHRGVEPRDFWSQSFCYGSAEIPQGKAISVRVRFRNDGGKAYARAEAHLVYRAAHPDATEVVFDWSDDAGPHRASHRFEPDGRIVDWNLPTGRNVVNRWVEFRPATARVSLSILGFFQGIPGS